MDWFEILLWLLVIGAGLLFGDRNKRRSPRMSLPGRRPLPPTPRRRPPLERGRVTAADNPRRVAQTILDQLLGGAQPRRPPPITPPLDTGEAVSLETLVPAGEASHKRFHERYMHEETPPPPAAPMHRMPINPTTARQAIVWQAVIGPPKALED